jgi:hypothetical protein
MLIKQPTKTYCMMIIIMKVSIHPEDVCVYNKKKILQEIEERRLLKTLQWPPTPQWWRGGHCGEINTVTARGVKSCRWISCPKRYDMKKDPTVKALSVNSSDCPFKKLTILKECLSYVAVVVNAAADTEQSTRMR